MLTIGRIDIGDAATRAGIRDVLDGIRAPGGSDWRAEIAAADDAWVLLVDGPRRLRPAEPEWTIVAAREGEARYRRLLRSAAERRASSIRTAVRKLMWEQIEVRENAIAVHDADLAEAMEHAVWDVLSGHDLPPVQVRLGSWCGASGERRYLCKVEARTLGQGGIPPWRWWSPMVCDADEVATWLQDMLQSREPGLRPRVDSGRPPARVPAASVARLV
jgi:hypothetical protein